MAGLFNAAQRQKIEEVAKKSQQALAPPPKAANMSGNKITSEVDRMSEEVKGYFPDSPAILITTVEQLHEYIDKVIECGYAGIDTETTGLDRVKDTIVGSSLYYPGGVECYIPNRHMVPIFDQPYKGQLSYEDCRVEFQRLVDAKTKLIFANADYDLAMIYKDYKVDFIDNCYYDVILAWRCIKEDELHNGLKELYNKYVMRGKGDPKKFSDFFTPTLFPYCKPEVAKLYAANDAKITYELFQWQLPYVTKTHPKCQKKQLEGIADMLWNLEIPLIKVCQKMHRTGMYLDKNVVAMLQKRYADKRAVEQSKLEELLEQEIKKCSYDVRSKMPFKSPKDFNPNSNVHMKYLLYTMMKIQGNGGTGKEVIAELNLPITNQILAIRSQDVLISTFVDKLPNATTADSRIHGQFKQIGADTGRFSSQAPNMQNIPSKSHDIRHLFRATPGYVMLSSDYSLVPAWL